MPAQCFAGAPSGEGSFDLGVLIELDTGLLRTDLSAPERVLVGSFCTSRSTITIGATPLVRWGRWKQVRVDARVVVRPDEDVEAVRARIVRRLVDTGVGRVAAPPALARRPTAKRRGNGNR